MSQIADEVFDRIESGSGSESECTPQVDSDFLGFKINAPKVVQFTAGERHPITGAFAKMMICGVYRVEAGAVADLGGIKQATTLSVIDVATHVSYVTKLGTPNFMDVVTDPPPPRPPRDEPNRVRFYMGYFNENVLDHLELPEGRAEYQVFVTLLKYKSNVVTIAVEPRQ